MIIRKDIDRLIIAAEDFKKEKDYWLKNLEGEIIAGAFPYDYKDDSKSPEREQNEFAFSIDGLLLERLVKLSKGVDHTLHMLLTAGWAALLAKYTGHKDILVGTVIYRQEGERDFINTLLPLRFQIEPQQGFKELLMHVRQVILSANENQNFPMEVLAREQNRASLGDYFNNALLLENIHDPAYLYAAPSMCLIFKREPRHTGGGTDGLKGRVLTDPRFYHPGTAGRIVSHFMNLLTALLENLSILPQTVDILSEDEKYTLLHEFNDTCESFPEGKTIHGLFEEQVRKNPDKPALNSFNDSEEPQAGNRGPVTYGELNGMADNLARLLNSRGVTNQSIVGIMMEPSLELAAGVMGILKAGGAFLPIEPEYPENRVANILQDSGSSMLLTREDVVRPKSITTLKNLHQEDLPITVTPARPQIQDFNGLPIPDRGLVDYQRIHNNIGCAMVKHTVSIQGSRGCPFNCAYCHKIWPKSHIIRSAENVLEEILYCYNAGARRFTFIDDVFNLDKKNSTRLLKSIIKEKLDVQLFFPNGLRGDLLDHDTIDLMVEAGTVDMALALETASPRIQKLIGKNLNLDKFRKNVEYIATKHRNVILEMEMMIGFPTETEEEAMMTLDFLKSVKWVHFPNLHILKIYHNTDMYKLAVANGVSPESISRSSAMAYHHLPETLPFPKSFARQFQARFMNEYILDKDRLKDLLPFQAGILNESEMVEKYNSYLPMDITCFDDLLNAAGLTPGEIGNMKPTEEEPWAAPGFTQNIKKQAPCSPHGTEGREKTSDAETPGCRILLMDLSQLFVEETGGMLYDVIEEPLGLMYLMTYLNHTLGDRIEGKVVKSRVDFENYQQLGEMLEEFKPDIIGIRTLTYYKDFFHRTVSFIRQCGIDCTIVAGGPYATSDYNLALADGNVDLAVLGEGEVTFRILVEKILENEGNIPPDAVLKDIQGLAFIGSENRGDVNAFNRDIFFLDHFFNNTNQSAGSVVGRSEGSTGTGKGVGESSLPIAAYEGPGRKTSPGDLLYLISTSGSTGKPKSIMIEHRTMTNLLGFQYSKTGIDFSGPVLQFASSAFDISPQEMFSTLLAGGCLYPVSGDVKGDIPRLFKYMEEENVSVAFLPPAFLKFVFSQPEYGGLFPSSIKHILAAGEQLVVTDSFRQHLEKNHACLHNHYGPAETHVTTTHTLTPEGDIPHLPPIGKPVSNTGIYILSESLSLQPIGTVGELYIGGIQVARGYLNNPDLTADRFIPLPDHLTARRANPCPRGGSAGGTLYRTGDLARWLPDGSIEFLGRADFQVKIRGFRIEPGEIEKRLVEIDYVGQVAVIDRQDRSGDRFLCAYIVSKETIDPAVLRDYLAAHLPDYMIPPYFVQVDGIPLTANGKVDKKALPEAHTVEEREDYVAPETQVQETMQDIWAAVLGKNHNRVGIDDNFFELGGHSLKATVMIAKTHKQLNVKIPLGEIFKMPTIRSLSTYIQVADKDVYASIPSAEKKEYYPLSSAQKRLFVLQHMSVDNIGYNMPRIIDLEPPVDDSIPDLSKLEEVFTQLMERHESLRTSFLMVDNEPVQRVHWDLCRTAAGKSPFKIRYTRLEETLSAEQIYEYFMRPFDLSQAPLMRAEVVGNGDGKLLLLVDTHHIITDGTSLSILEKEFDALYQGEQLSPLHLQYRDYSQWNTGSRRKELVQQQERFWLDTFAGELPVLDLPYDFPRPVTQGFEGCSVDFMLGSEESRRLKQMTAQKDITIYMAILAVYTIFLSKLSGTDDIIVGTPFAARRHSELEPLIGMFANTLALRNFPEANLTVNAYLDALKKNTVAAFDNQEYPFEDIVEQVAVRRDGGRNPLFDAMFNLLNHTEYEGMPTEEYREDKNEHVKGTSKFDLNLLAVDTGERFFFNLEYSTKLFKPGTIDSFIRYFRNTLTAITAAGGYDAPLAKIDILPEQEKERILQMASGVTEKWDTMPIHRMFERQVEKTPDAFALKAPGEISATYRQLNEQADQLAHLMLTRGITNTVIGLMLERSVEMVAGILAILKAGNTCLPIDTDLPGDRITFMLEDSGAGALLTTRAMEDKACTSIELIYPDDPGIKSANAQHIAGNPGNPPTRDLTADGQNPLYIIYTSGSTGTPKGVVLEHRNLANLIRFQYTHTNIDFSRVLQFAAISFDVSFQEIFSTLCAGGELVLIPKESRNDVETLMKIIGNYDIKTLFLPASYLKSVLNEDIYLQAIPSCVRHIVTAGEQAVLTGRFRRYLKESKVYLHNHYGPSETHVVTSLTLNPADELPELPSIGRPVANTKIDILNPAGLLVPCGVPGELFISGAQVGGGYLNNPQLTGQRFIKSTEPGAGFIYKTGDLARWLPDTTIQFLGRIDRQVKIRGYRIEPGEIENRISNHPAVKSVAVVDGENASGHRYLCAYVVPRSSNLDDTGSDALRGELREHLLIQLPDYMIPSFFVFMEEIPLTPNGKVDRVALPLPEGPMGLTVYVAPQNPREEQLASIWRELLGRERIGIDDNFFDLGGQSILAMKAVARVIEETGIRLPISVFFQSGTIREISKRIVFEMESAKKSGDAPKKAPAGATDIKKLKRQKVSI
ncbi:MAG: amino acid adenylation domain-containing protein [bacterium]|nr:amino acid adenylation domain-containing protein [bacterium]